MRNSEKILRLGRRPERIIWLAIVFCGFLSIACGAGSLTSLSQTNAQPTLPPLSEWVKVRCQFQDTVTGQYHDQIIVAPRAEGGVGYEKQSLCYKKDFEYREMIDAIQGGKVSRNDVSIGQQAYPAIQADLGQ